MLENFREIIRQHRIEAHIRYDQFLVFGVQNYSSRLLHLSFRATQLPAGRNISVVVDAPDSNKGSRRLLHIHATWLSGYNPAFGRIHPELMDPHDARFRAVNYRARRNISAVSTVENY